MRNLLFGLTFLLLFPFFELNAQFPPGFAAISLLQDFDPTAMTLAPNGDIFIAEKNGRVLIIRNGQALPQAFIELPVDNYNERGLSGIVTHPEYPAIPYVYLYYTVPAANHNRLARVSAAGDQADPATLVTLLDLDPLQGTIHNGGAMQFGTDGKLYVAVGDGAGAGQVQQLNTLAGKVLRINPDGSIPDDNPFYAQTNGKYRSIWALGFRNPFTFSQQPGTGRLVIGDVGSEFFEEVNILEKGKNYGWPLVEGYLQNGVTPPANYQNPLHAYPHTVGCCIVGAAFYNPAQNLFPPGYNGRLFFGEYCQGKIWHIDPVNGGAPVEFANNLNRPLCLLTHPDGNLYCITRGGLGGGSDLDNTSSDEGVLWRITYNPNGLPLVATQPADQFVSQQENARFEVRAASNPPFTYQWMRNGAAINGATNSVLELNAVVLADSGSVFSCQIQNNAGAVQSNTAMLRVTANQRPEATISAPAPGQQYRAGQILTFAGSATDAESGALGAEKLAWRIDFHHDNHVHPGLPYTTGISTGAIPIPQVGETAHNVWYRVHLFANDPDGLSRHVWRDVFPEKTTLEFNTSTPGLTLNLDGQPFPAPIRDTSVVGVIRSIAAPAINVLDGLPYLFTAWSDGRTENLLSFPSPEAALNLVARYESLPVGEGSGLMGLYFNNDNGTFTRPLSAWRVDETLDFYWGQGTPFPPNIGADNFAVRWIGQVEPWRDGEYRFYLKGDDGVRLWIDGNLVIDSWVPSDGEVRVSMPLQLEAGKRYDIRIEMFEIAGEAELRLEWSLNDGGASIIPKTQLYPEPFFNNNPSTAKDGPLLCQITPNPFRDNALLQAFSTNYLNLKVQMFDATGRQLRKLNWYTEPGFNNLELGLDGLAAGIYFIQVTGNDIRINLKAQKM